MNVKEFLIDERARARVGGTLNGKYRLDRLLGVGGMAAVYAATHRNSKRFAVKLLHPELSLQADTRRRFLREGYVANSVEHRGAVAVLDDDVSDDGAAFLVMELLDGASLDVVCTASAGKLPLDAVLAIAAQLLDVLSAADAKSIVHRDIKPANLFVTKDGQLKVLDFGIARLREIDGSSTTTGMTLGTPAYMAPEQALGHSEAISARTDIWAVGATMFALLSGRAVHKARSGPEQLVFAATKPAAPLKEAAPDVAESVCAIVDKALAFAPADRWPTAAAMAEAVRGAYAEHFPGHPMRHAIAAIAKEIPSVAAMPAATPVMATASAGPVSPKASTVSEATPAATSAPLAASVIAPVPSARRESPMRTARRLGTFVALLAVGVGVGVMVTRGARDSAEPRASATTAAPVSAGIVLSAGAAGTDTGLATDAASAPPSRGADRAAIDDAGTHAALPYPIARPRSSATPPVPSHAPPAASSSAAPPTRDSFDHQ